MSNKYKKRVTRLPAEHQIMLYPLAIAGTSLMAVISGPLNQNWIEGMPTIARIMIAEKRTFHKMTSARFYMARRLGESTKAPPRLYQICRLYPLDDILTELRGTNIVTPAMLFWPNQYGVN